MRESLSQIIKEKIARKNLEEFILEEPSKVKTTGDEDSEEKTATLSRNYSQPASNQRRKLVALQQKSVILGEEQNLSRSSKDEEKEKKANSQADGSAIAKSPGRNSSESGTSRSIMKSRLKNLNKDDDEHDRRSLNIINEEGDANIFRHQQRLNDTMDNDKTSGPITQRRKTAIAQAKMSERTTNSEQPFTNLVKSGSILISNHNIYEKKIHKRNPSSGNLLSKRKNDLEEDTNIMDAFGEYMSSISPDKISQQVSFRKIEPGTESKAKACNLQTVLSNLFKKKLRTSLYFIMLFGNRKRISTKDSSQRLELRNLSLANLNPQNPGLDQQGSSKMMETERSIIFTPENPVNNKNIEYKKVITVARMLIRLQQNCNILVNQSLHSLVRFKNEAKKGEKVGGRDQEQ